MVATATASPPPRTVQAALAPSPRVNLMPRAETERRAKAALARRWTIAILATLVVVAAVSAAAFWLQFAAMTRLAAENTRTTALLGELGAMSDVRNALALEDELVEFRAASMATDVEWMPLLATLASTLPEGAGITGFALSPAGAPVGDDPAAEIGVTGTLSVVSGGVDQIGSLVRAIRPLPGVLEVDGWTSTFENGAYTHEIRIALDQTAYTGDFAEEAAE